MEPAGALMCASDIVGVRRSEDALYFLFFAIVTYLCDGLFLFSE